MLRTKTRGQLFETLIQPIDKFFVDILVAFRKKNENAQAMIDGLFYAEIPPEVKHSLSLENTTYDNTFLHLERELEFIGLEEGDHIPVPIMTTATTPSRPRSIFIYRLAWIQAQIIANSKVTSKTTVANLNEMGKTKCNEVPTANKQYLGCPICDKTKYPAERC